MNDPLLWVAVISGGLGIGVLLSIGGWYMIAKFRSNGESDEPEQDEQESQEEQEEQPEPEDKPRPILR